MEHYKKALEEGKVEFEEKYTGMYQSPHVIETFKAWNNEATPENVKSYLTQFAEKIRRAVVEDVVEYCKKVMEINTRVYGTDKWNGDLEDLVKFLSDLPTKENN